jgi:hypothetical protein
MTVDERLSALRLPLAATLLAASGLVTLWGYAIVVFPHLPALLPVHFNGRGEPDRWVATTAGSWFSLPGVGTGVMALMLGAAWFSRWAAIRRPQLVNIPFKDRFLAAPPHRRAWIVEPIVTALAVDAIGLAGMFLFLLHGTERVANGAWSTLSPAGALLFVPLLILVPLSGVGWTAWRAGKS